MMRRWRAPVAVLAAAGTVGVLGPAGPATSTVASVAPPPATAAAVPAEAVRTYRTTVPVNVVLIGLDGQLAPGIRRQLPRSSAPVVRYPQFYGLPGRDLGLDFTYRYRMVDAPRAFENRFFRHLRATGTPRPLTSVQQAYNDQQGNVLDVRGPVLDIDAASTERWLAREAARSLGIGPRSYTVFLVNWFDRPNFRFHVYSKTDEVDPDTGANFGERDTRAMTSWGGTHSRTWFYDVSAGPEAWSSNWNVDDADVDGDEVPDLRFPPVWEYAPDGFRRPWQLAGDLGRMVRFVAINLLFTSSPLYDPLVTAPRPGGAKAVPVTMLQDDPAVDGREWVQVRTSAREWRALEPYHRWRTWLRNVDPIDPASRRSFRIFAGLSGASDCWEDYGTPFAQLFCYVDANPERFGKDQPRDYEARALLFNTTDARMGNFFGLLGFADDNWVDGTQSYVFAFDTPTYRDAGFGFTTTLTHEVGHHIGLSHPHDGYDPTLGVNYGPTGEYLFAWVGDMSDTVMHYLGTSNGFGRFDQDNMGRYQFAGYANWALTLADQVADADGLDADDRAALRSVRESVRAAEEAFERWSYQSAARRARAAYVQAQLLADRVGVSAAVAAAPFRFTPQIVDYDKGDPIRFPDEEFEDAASIAAATG
jgi:hypothetical protein